MVLVTKEIASCVSNISYLHKTNTSVFSVPSFLKEGEHNDVGFVEISKMFVMQDAIFFGTEPFDGVYIQVFPLID